MSATIWVNTERDETIELGGTIQLYKAFQEMALVAGEGFHMAYPDLFGVPSQTEDTADADPEWLQDAREQAARFLAEYSDDLSEHTCWLLEQLLSGPVS